MSYPENTDTLTIDRDELLTALGEIDDKKDEASSATGELRAQIKDAQTGLGVHKSALAIIRQLNDYPTKKRADVRRSLNPMLSIMDAEWDRAERDMVDAAEAETADMEASMGEAAE